MYIRIQYWLSLSAANAELLRTISSDRERCDAVCCVSSLIEFLFIYRIDGIVQRDQSLNLEDGPIVSDFQ